MWDWKLLKAVATKVRPRAALAGCYQCSWDCLCKHRQWYCLGRFKPLVTDIRFYTNPGGSFFLSVCPIHGFRYPEICLNLKDTTRIFCANISSLVCLVSPFPSFETASFPSHTAWFDPLSEAGDCSCSWSLLIGFISVVYSLPFSLRYKTDYTV